MQHQEEELSIKKPFPTVSWGQCKIPKEIGYDANSKNVALEGTVIWIGKDSESKSDLYLEECNTHQSGE
jgi:hypothetical protein